MAKTTYTAHRKFYLLWNNIRQRCENSNNPNYKRYGARGIKVCNRWQEFNNFKMDMFPTYKKGLWIERINNDGDYDPDNCKWATRKEQLSNTRRSCYLTWKGITKTIPQWVEYLKIKSSTLRQRFYVYHWSIEKCLTYTNKENYFGK
jgi:hypothetical protein